MRTREFFNRTLNCGTIFDHTQCASVLLAAALAHLPAAAATLTPPETASPKTIPWAEVGAAAGAQYSGDGLSVTPTPDGARLRCVFHRMDGEASREGLWLNSTVTTQAIDRFRVTAAAFGRTGSPLLADGAPGVTRSIRLPATGIVSVDDNTARFTRPGLVEEYSVNMDGVRQDFVVLEKPLPLNPQPSTLNQAELRVELSVFGARVEPMAGGAGLVLENSSRKIAYSRLKVTDANGKRLAARIEVPPNLAMGAPHSTLGMAFLVDDADAVYPVRIDPTFSDANWISMGGIPGTDGVLYAAVSDASGNLYIGGHFAVVGDVVANGIAKWNGSSWGALGSGIGGGDYPSVRALVVSGSDLYVGGDFTTAGGSAANRIAKWNGTSWSAVGSGMGGDYPSVYALAVSGGDLYVGGHFTTAGTVAATNIARWNGTSWSAVGSGMGGNYPAVYALAVSGGDLYVGGHFTTAGTVAATNIARWNGSSWSAVGSGITAPAGDPYYDGIVRALVVSGSDLYMGGHFTTAGGIAATNIAKWDGGSWSALGAGMNYYVYTLAVSGSDLYAGGSFTTAGGISANNIAKWNGSNWSALGSGTYGYYPYVFALAMSGNALYAGGAFAVAGGIEANNIANWDGGNWSALSAWINGGVSALAVSVGDLYVGGGFTTSGGISLNYIGKWNGSSWTALGSGMNGWVRALAVSGSDVYAGGQFTSAGGIAATNIARWNGGSWNPLGSGISGPVYALAVSGNNLYAGGAFAVAGGIEANNIAKWDGTSWSALGSGIEGYNYTAVFALAVSGSNLFAGGSFWTAGGQAADLIAKWDGSNWSALGSGLGGDRGGPFKVSALAVSGSDLYAGGAFWIQGGIAVANIAKWNGSSWSALGSGITGVLEDLGCNCIMWPDVQALAVSGNDLYAGGYFTTADSVSATNIAKWNGSSWSALGSGVNGDSRVSALGVMGSDLYVGGGFTTAGGKVSAYLARAIINPPVLTLERNASGTNFIRFSGVPGTAYHLQRAPGLAGPWPNIATNIAPAQGRIEVGDSSPPQNQAFYRVVEP